jgi:hypothetical protein
MLALLQISCDDDLSPVYPDNSPPRSPYLPEPEDSSTYASENLVVSWECSDPDGDALIYSIHVREGEEYIVFSTQTPYKTVDTGHFLLRSTRYTWRVIASDGLELTAGEWWTFFTPEWSNEPPYAASDPTPENGAADIPLTNLHLSWSASDPDQDDVLTYTVFFGTNDDPEIVAAGITETSYALPQLDYGTEYFWRVVTTDSRDESASGPVWSFTTRADPGGLLSRIGRFLGLSAE